MSFHSESITDLRSGAAERCSNREAQGSTFARFLGLFDFRLLQQYLPKPEVPSLHSIISSAVDSSEGGTVRPRALTVFRLMTNLKRVGCSMGRSRGFAPFSILST